MGTSPSTVPAASHRQDAEHLARWRAEKDALDRRSAGLATRAAALDEKRRAIAAIPGVLSRAFSRAVHAPALYLRQRALEKSQDKLDESKRDCVYRFYDGLRATYLWGQGGPDDLQKQWNSQIALLNKVREVKSAVRDALHTSSSAENGSAFSAGTRNAATSAFASMEADKARQQARYATGLVQALSAETGRQMDSAAVQGGHDAWRYVGDALTGFGMLGAIQGLGTAGEMADIKRTMDRTWDQLDAIDLGLLYNGLYGLVDRAVAGAPAASQAARELGRELRAYVQANPSLTMAHMMPVRRTPAPVLDR